MLAFFLLALATAQPPAFEDLLRKLSSAPADPCELSSADYRDLERRLFDEADRSVTQKLNEAP